MIKLDAWGLQPLNKKLIKRLQHRCFPVNFAEFLRPPFLQNSSMRLLLTNKENHSSVCKICLIWLYLSLLLRKFNSSFTALKPLLGGVNKYSHFENSAKSRWKSIGVEDFLIIIGCWHSKNCKKNGFNLSLFMSYSSSYNLTPPISRVLIDRYLIFCSLTSPKCCNSARKCTPVKYKARQRAGFPIVT